jgi:hypothetical protein
MRPPARLIGLAACFASCATPGAPRAPAAQDQGAIVTVGERCKGGACACRELDATGRGPLTQEGAVEAGQKRFELRTGRGLDQVTITVEGRGTLTKPSETAAGACAYIDLPPGKHHVRYRAVAARPDEGMAPALLINEYSSRTHDWYDTFRFKCGDPEPCTKDDLADWGQKQQALSRGILDPCGSTRVENVRWDVAHTADVRVTELTLDFVLEVYKFSPRFRHGGECKGLQGSVPADEAP